MSKDTLTTTFADIRLRLLHIASRMLGNEDDANDALQDAFCRLWRHKDEISTRSQAEALSVTAVKNLCIDNLRKQKNTYQISIDQNNEAETVTYEDDNADIEELYDKVNQIIDFRLSDTQKMIVRMRDEEEMSFEIIAEKVNMTEANVRVQLSRARKAIRECYRKLKQDETI